MPRPLPLILLWLFILPLAAEGNEDAIKQQVQVLVREAGQMMDRGDRAGAVARLQAARALRPDPVLDYNLGIAYAEWGKGPEAATALSRFLRGVDRKAVTPDRLADAEQRLDGYRRTLARLAITASAPPLKAGACTVFIDSLTIGPAPIEERWMVPGPHSLRVSAPGARDYMVSLALGPGEERAISAELQPPVAGQGLAFVPLQQAHQEPPGPLYRRWWFWLPIAGGAVLVAGLVGAAAAGRFNHVAPGSDLDPVDVAR